MIEYEKLCLIFQFLKFSPNMFEELASIARSGLNEIRDREKAIIHGSTLIGENDCLAILGKGHEEIQEENGVISFFSDHEVVNEIYK